MSGGIAQLVAVGAQDAHLVGQPEVSFFRSNYKRHTNFAQTVERQVIQGNPSSNGMSTVRFERKGDMVGYVYIAPTKAGKAHKLTPAEWVKAISKVELLIGGQVIDEQTSQFSQYMAPTILAQNLTKSTSGFAEVQSKFYPLRFSFCENAQTAIPLIALQYHDVELRITWGSDLDAATYEVYSQFIHLDTDERTALSSTPQNMLITQTQKAISSDSKTQELNFNHPIKCLVAASELKAGSIAPAAMAANSSGGNTVTASGTYADVYKAFDGSDSTFHRSTEYSYTGSGGHGNGNTLGGVGGEWIQIQLASAITPISVSLKGPTAASPDALPATWVILGSNDGTSWTQIHSSTTAVTNAGITESITNTTSYTYLAIVVTAIVAGTGNHWRLSRFSFTGASVNRLAIADDANKMKLQINGTDVTDFKYVDPNYTAVTSYYHTVSSKDAGASGENDKFFLYPFCLDTSKVQPTGSLNFSRLDSARLVNDTANSSDDIYAVNYNVLRIENGMGGLMYSN